MNLNPELNASNVMNQIVMKKTKKQSSCESTVIQRRDYLLIFQAK